MSRIVILLYASIFYFLPGCRYLEHTPYYDTVEHSQAPGIKKLDTLLPETNAQIYKVTQNARDHWTDSDISIEKGEQVQIRAKGFWGCRVEELGYDGPQGSGIDTRDRFPWNALLGKLGIKGDPFLVGSLCTFEALRSGKLFFIMNDGIYCYDNNSGKINITVAVMEKKIGETKPDRITQKVEKNAIDIECDIQLIHLRTGEIHGKAAAGCRRLSEVPAMVDFLAKKLYENTMVRREGVGILPLREIGAVAQKQHLGDKIDKSLFSSLSQMDIFRLLPPEKLHSLMLERGMTLEDITPPIAYRIEGLDYIIVGKVTTKNTGL